MNSPKKIARRLVLRENHPTAIKVAKLCDLANELGISISFLHQRVLVTDEERDKNLPPLYIEDIEENHWFEGLPFESEYKLVYENPEFIALQKFEQEETNRVRADTARILREREEEKAKAEAEEKAKALKVRELRILAELKEKYKDE